MRWFTIIILVWILFEINKSYVQLSDACKAEWMEGKK